MSDLIDTTEMYLRTIYELEEEGIVLLRARIAEILNHSGPTVSQTVARMERDGLLSVQGDRHLELSAEGRQVAIRVMRKHRLAERLLLDVIGLDIELVHQEACRWEHVMSEDVERRLIDLLEHPNESPYGNPIPGLEEFGESTPTITFLDGVQPLTAVVNAAADQAEVEIVRLGEPLQADPVALASVVKANALPGKSVLAQFVGAKYLLANAGEKIEISQTAAAHIFVKA